MDWSILPLSLLSTESGARFLTLAFNFAYIHTYTYIVFVYKTFILVLSWVLDAIKFNWFVFFCGKFKLHEKWNIFIGYAKVRWLREIAFDNFLFLDWRELKFISNFKVITRGKVTFEFWSVLSTLIIMEFYQK